MYKSLLQPLLLYGINIWGQASKKVQEKLLLLQKRALRSIFFLNSTHSAVPLFTETEILPVTLLYFYSTAQLMYDVNHNFAPTNISNIFTQVKDIHNYDTRFSSSENYYIKYSRLNTQKNDAICLWNQIPAHIRNL